MKKGAVLLLMVGLLCGSMLGSAQEPVPFKALMQNGGSEPAAPGPQGSSAAAPQKPQSHMTRGGKVEMGIGIGLVALGGIFIAGGASVKDSDWLASETRAIGYGGGAVFAGSGVTLIYLGKHRRK